MHALCDSLINSPPTHTQTYTHTCVACHADYTICGCPKMQLKWDTKRLGMNQKKSAIKYNKIKLIIKSQRQPAPVAVQRRSEREGKSGERALSVARIVSPGGGE